MLWVYSHYKYVYYYYYLLSKDGKMNKNGRHLLNFCKLTSYVMLNGQFGRDQDVGEYTCINTRGRSVVDYVLCRPVDFPYLTDFEIIPQSIHSDHCPLRLNVKFNYTPHVDIRNTENVREKCLKWDPCKKQKFINMLDEDSVQNRFVGIFENVGHSDSPVDVDNLVND